MAAADTVGATMDVSDFDDAAMIQAAEEAEVSTKRSRSLESDDGGAESDAGDGEPAAKKRRTESGSTEELPKTPEPAKEEQKEEVKLLQKHPNEFLKSMRFYWRNTNVDNITLRVKEPTKDFTDYLVTLWDEKRNAALMIGGPAAVANFCKTSPMGNFNAYYPGVTNNFSVTDELFKSRFSVQLLSTPVHPLSKANEFGQDIEMLEFCEWLVKLRDHVCKLYWDDPLLGPGVRKAVHKKYESFYETQLDGYKNPGMEEAYAELKSEAGKEKYMFNMYMKKLTNPVKLRKIKDGDDPKDKKEVPHTENINVSQTLWYKCYGGKKPKRPSYVDEVKEAKAQYDDPTNNREFRYPRVVNTATRKIMSPNQVAEHVTDGAICSALINPKPLVAKTIGDSMYTGFSLSIDTVYYIPDAGVVSTRAGLTDAQVIDDIPQMS